MCAFIFRSRVFLINPKKSLHPTIFFYFRHIFIFSASTLYFTIQLYYYYYFYLTIFGTDDKTTWGAFWNKDLCQHVSKGLTVSPLPAAQRPNKLNSPLALRANTRNCVFIHLKTFKLFLCMAGELSKTLKTRFQNANNNLQRV